MSTLCRCQRPADALLEQLRYAKRNHPDRRADAARSWPAGSTASSAAPSTCCFAAAAA